MNLADAPQKLDRLDFYLSLWQTYMHTGSNTRGYPGRAAGFSAGGYSQDFDDMVDSVDRRAAEATDAVIRGLPMDQQCALHHRYLAAVFRFRNYGRSLYFAREAVREGLKKRQIWVE